MVVTRTELPSDSRLHRYVERGDFLDCFSVDIGRANVSIDEIAQRLFIGLPRWIDVLLGIRDLGVSPFGLKTTARLPTNKEIRSSVAVGEPINFFCVRTVGENEVIVGEDDRHLDFKIAVHRDSDRANRVSLATWARPHNRLGRVYLRVVEPFHVRIAKARLAALARQLAVIDRIDA